MGKKGYYTGRMLPNRNIVGKISGYNSSGEPVYNILDKQGFRKIGQLQNHFIKKQLKQR